MATMNASAASSRTEESIASYLNRIRWDGTARSFAFASQYLGAADTDDHCRASGAWLTGAVARAMNPGCKLAGVPVLVGPQGIGKSSAIAALNGQPPVQLADAASYVDIAGEWHVEIDPENADKSFLDAKADAHRPRGSRKWSTIPRTCFFVGTTSASPPRGPRFMPIVVGRIDLAAIRRDRDQLWAEAVANMSPKNARR